MKIVNGWALPDSDTYFVDSAYEGGFQLERLREAMKFCTSRRIALDVGAHVGFWTKELLAQGFEKVLAFEPAPDTFECLKRNVSIFDTEGRVSLHHVAVGEVPGRARIQEDALRKGNTGSRYVKFGPSGGIPTVSLDSLHLTDDVDFIKLDAEGAEPLILVGAADTIMRCRPVVYVEQKKGFGSRFGVIEGMAAEMLEQWGATEVFRVKADSVFKF